MKAFIRKDLAIADYGLPPSLMERLRTIGFGFEPPDFATEFAEHLEAILLEPYEFAGKAPKAPKAGGKEKKCNPAKSHFCQKEGGAGACIPLSKKCGYKPDGDGKTVSGYLGEKAPEVKAKVAPPPPPPPSKNPVSKAQLDAEKAKAEPEKKKFDPTIEGLPPANQAKVNAYLDTLPDDQKEATRQKIADAWKAQQQAQALPKAEPKPEPKPAPELGASTGKWVTPPAKKVVGQGVFGKVYLTNNGTVVKKMKEPNPLIRLPDHDMAMEIKLAQKVGELGIGPKVIGGDAQSRAYEMEFLGDYKPLSKTKKKDIDSDVIDDLEENIGRLHANRIAHNDLHQGNVMVADGKTKIIDMGLAKEFPAVDDIDAKAASQIMADHEIIAWGRPPGAMRRTTIGTIASKGIAELHELARIADEVKKVVAENPYNIEARLNQLKDEAQQKEKNLVSITRQYLRVVNEKYGTK